MLTLLRFSWLWDVGRVSRTRRESCLALFQINEPEPSDSSGMVCSAQILYRKKICPGFGDVQVDGLLLLELSLPHPPQLDQGWLPATPNKASHTTVASEEKEKGSGSIAQKVVIYKAGTMA